MGNKELRNDAGRIEGEGVGNQATPQDHDPNAPATLQLYLCRFCGLCARHCPKHLFMAGQRLYVPEALGICRECPANEAPLPDGYSPQPPPNGWTAKTLSEALGQFPPDSKVLGNPWGYPLQIRFHQGGVLVEEDKNR
jgi:hypothetical protein